MVSLKVHSIKKENCQQPFIDPLQALGCLLLNPFDFLSQNPVFQQDDLSQMAYNNERLTDPYKWAFYYRVRILNYIDKERCDC